MTWLICCTRCLLPTVDQETGIRDPDQQPWKTLKTYRLKPELYSVFSHFGIRLASDTNGIIRVGDEIEILKENKNF
ncbi:unnamed protein product [Didymodactylos carnosus]|nr:unnamed protein product [Didymodactylos carnosus]CAF4570691.1 unnamed protein product [Didymodactylos carnosus]